MANSILVSSISCAPCRTSLRQPAARIVDDVIAYLKGRIGQVLPDQPDLIVVPEVCDRPMDMPDGGATRRYYRARGERVLDALRKIARAHRCYLTYPAFHELPDGTWRNSVMLIDRGGDVCGTYHKNHLVIEENTEGGALYGKEATVFTCDFGRVAAAICFDLNFDELLLKHKAAAPDLILFCSVYHGGLRQRHWAYACRAHLVSAIGGARGGCGWIVNPLGEIIAHTTNYFDFVTARMNLDCCVAHLGYNEEKLSALKAKYKRDVTISDPGYLGPVLVTSEMPQRTVRQMVKEFDIELLDDYMARALAHRHAPGRIEA